MQTDGTFFCELCGELPSLKKPPQVCPICGGEINFVAGNQQAKRFPTSDERAAEWFKKMREVIEL